jgi:hypothetical protein
MSSNSNSSTETNFSTPQTFEDEPFSDKWPFASAIKKELGAWGYTVEVDPEKKNFSSGRAILMFTFYKGNGPTREILSKRDGMVLTSKAGNPYHVVSKTARV